MPEESNPIDPVNSNCLYNYPEMVFSVEVFMMFY